MRRLQSVPCPRLRALAERVIENDRQVYLLRLVLRHSGFECLLVVGDDGKTLRWNPIAFRRISITAERNTQFAFVVRSQDNAARDILRESLLEDSSINYFDRE